MQNRKMDYALSQIRLQLQMCHNTWPALYMCRPILHELAQAFFLHSGDVSCNLSSIASTGFRNIA